MGGISRNASTEIFSLKCKRQTASSSSHFWATKEMKYVWKFQKLCFRNRDKSRSSKIWQRLLHPNRLFKTMNALFATSSSKLKRRISSSWIKCLEHIKEFRVGSLRSPLFYEINPLLSPDISLFPGFRHREKELRVKLNPCAHLGRQNILQQHIYLAYFVYYSKKLLSGSPK